MTLADYLRQVAARGGERAEIVHRDYPELFTDVEDNDDNDNVSDFVADIDEYDDDMEDDAVLSMKEDFDSDDDVSGIDVDGIVSALTGEVTEREFGEPDDDVLNAPDEGPAYGMAETINSLIRDEWEAIDGYNSAIVMARNFGEEDVAESLTHIQNEENKHVGELQELLKRFTTSADKIEDGTKEAKSELNDEDVLHPFMGNTVNPVANAGEVVSVGEDDILHPYFNS